MSLSRSSSSSFSRSRMNSQSSLSTTATTVTAVTAATSLSYQQQLNDDLPVDVDLNRIPCKKKLIERIVVLLKWFCYFDYSDYYHD